MPNPGKAMRDYTFLNLHNCAYAEFFMLDFIRYFITGSINCRRGGLTVHIILFDFFPER